MRVAGLIWPTLGYCHGALTAPATFLFGADGTIQFAFVNPGRTVRLAPDVLLAAARAETDDPHERLKRTLIRRRRTRQS